MPRLAWFSPMPPVSTGVAACSAELVAALGRDHQIDVFVHRPSESDNSSTLRSAHDFVWLHRLRPYDLNIYQLGNSSHHDYQWPYLFRYPGLTVLHDAHLHHARAAFLLGTSRADDYRTEFAWNHAEANPDLAELAVAGFDSHLHYAWPMTRLVTIASRLVAVHGRALANRLQQDVTGARIEAIHLGHGTLLSEAEDADLKKCARGRYGIPSDAIVFGCYGGLTPDKRLTQVLAAFAATRAFAPTAHLLLAGAVPDRYDLGADIARHGLQDCTTLTGYVAADEDFTACIAACDVALNLRWPTAREISGPWLRCLAAGKPTVIVDLAHMIDVPTIDPRTWRPLAARGSAFDKLRPTLRGIEGSGFPSDAGDPCAVAIDILDEDHSLRLALRRLATDPSLRTALGNAARQYWSANHSIDVMVADYQRLIAECAGTGIEAADPQLPAHLVDDCDRGLVEMMVPFEMMAPFERLSVFRSRGSRSSL